METSSKRLEWLLRELRIGKSDLARRLNTHPNNSRRLFSWCKFPAMYEIIADVLFISDMRQKYCKEETSAKSTTFRYLSQKITPTLT